MLPKTYLLMLDHLPFEVVPSCLSIGIAIETQFGPLRHPSALPQVPLDEGKVDGVQVDSALVGTGKCLCEHGIAIGLLAGHGAA